MAGMPAALAAATNPGGRQNETTSDAPASASRGTSAALRTVPTATSSPSATSGAIAASTAGSGRGARGRQRVVGIGAAENRQDALPRQRVDRAHGYVSLDRAQR